MNGLNHESRTNGRLRLLVGTSGYSGCVRDFVCCALLTIGTVLYIDRWPRDFFIFDEGLFLYGAKRILVGDIIYRDFFEIITPGAFYGMALVFALFGVSIESARLSMALVHVASVLLIYSACRTIGVRRSVAIPAGIAYVALSYPALPIASPHWVSTALMLAIFVVMLRRPLVRGWAHSFLAGILVGLMICVQQQKGLVFAAGLVPVILGGCLLATNPSPRLRRGTAHVFAFVGGISAAVLPMLIFLLATAGSQAIYAALVQFPLENYREYHTSMSWGRFSKARPDIYVHPVLIQYLVAVSILPFLHLIRSVWARDRGETVERSFTLLALCGLSVLSVAYNPNYNHLAMIAPVFFIVLADSAERFFVAIERRLPGALLVTTVAALSLVVGGIVQLRANLRQRLVMYPIQHPTAFGVVRFANDAHIALLETVLARLEGSPKRDLFCYPACAGLYLMTDTRNPTRYQVLQPGYSRPEHVSEVVRDLADKNVEWVAFVLALGLDRQDPVMRHLRSHYHRVKLVRPAHPIAVALFQRSTPR